MPPRLVLLAALSLACDRPVPTDPDGVPVTDPPAPTVEGVLDALSPCQGLEPDGRVDLPSGCADGGCAGMTRAELDASWGTQATCRTSSSEATVVYCAWPSGVWTRFADLDEDGVPDDRSHAFHLYLEPPYDGATTDGLGPGASLGCFVDALGYPEVASVADGAAGLAFRYLSWPADGVAVYDTRGEGWASTVVVSGAE